MLTTCTRQWECSWWLLLNRETFSSCLATFWNTGCDAVTVSAVVQNLPLSNGCNNNCRYSLCLGMARLSWPGWLVTLKMATGLKHVTHPTTNLTQHYNNFVVQDQSLPYHYCKLLRQKYCSYITCKAWLFVTDFLLSQWKKALTQRCKHCPHAGCSKVRTLPTRLPVANTQTDRTDNNTLCH